MTLKTKEYGLMMKYFANFSEILHPLLSVLQTKQRLMKVKKIPLTSQQYSRYCYLSNYDECNTKIYINDEIEKLTGLSSFSE
jgi:hypothetical protein